MWTFNKFFEAIDQTDIDNLIQNQVAEQQCLEYKKEPYGGSDSERKEMLRDITSFANAYGGYILIGIEEDGNGIPIRVVGVNNPEDEKNRMLSCCVSSIDPRISGLRFGIISMTKSNPVILIHIPRSTHAPHMITWQGSCDFWIRHECQKSRMSIEEIRDACLRTENIIQKIEEFIEQRKIEILSEIVTPIYIIGAGPIILGSDLVDINDSQLVSVLKNKTNQRMDGWNLIFQGIDPKPTLQGLYLKDYRKRLDLYRNGYIELQVEINYISKQVKLENETVNIFYGCGIVEYAVYFYRLLKRISEYLGLNETFFGWLSLYEIQNYELRRYGQGPNEPVTDINPINRWLKKDLEIQPMQIPTIDNPDLIAKNFLDKIWNAFEYNQAPFFKNNIFAP